MYMVKLGIWRGEGTCGCDCVPVHFRVLALDAQTGPPADIYIDIGPWFGCLGLTSSAGCRKPGDGGLVGHIAWGVQWRHHTVRWLMRPELAPVAAGGRWRCYLAMCHPLAGIWPEPESPDVVVCQLPGGCQSQPGIAYLQPHWLCL